jgi:5,10-methylenetetrahydromethanopterin reductase
MVRRYKEMGICFTGVLPARDIANHVAYAERKGFTSAWLADDYFFRSGFAFTSICAYLTQKVEIAISITNPYTRHPALLAMDVATLDELSGGRIIFGMGGGVRYWMEQMDYKYTGTLGRIRETKEILDALLRGPSSYQGKYFRLRNVNLEFNPVRKKIPFYIGAMGPKMLELSGEIGNGAILSALASVEYHKFVKKHVALGAEKVSRKLRDFETVTLFIFAVDRNSQTAKDLVKPLIALYLGAIGVNPLFTEGGTKEEELRPFIEAVGRGKPAVHLVTDELVDRLAIAGTPEECCERLMAYREAGVTIPVPLLTSPRPKKMIDLIHREILPRVL